MKWIYLCATVCLIPAGVRGDAPKRPPSTYRIFSLNGAFYADVNYPEKKTTAYRGKPGSQAVKLWEVPGWYRVAAISNDGQSLVTGYDGSNLLSKGFTSEEIMLIFYNKGQKVGVVRLRELISDLSRLEKTSSHWMWGEYLGFDKENRYQVKTVEGKLLRFDPATGKQVP